LTKEKKDTAYISKPAISENPKRERKEKEWT